MRLLLKFQPISQFINSQRVWRWVVTPFLWKKKNTTESRWGQEAVSMDAFSTTLVTQRHFHTINHIKTSATVWARTRKNQKELLHCKNKNQGCNEQPHLKMNMLVSKFWGSQWVEGEWGVDAALMADKGRWNWFKRLAEGSGWLAYITAIWPRWRSLLVKVTSEAVLSLETLDSWWFVACGNINRTFSQELQFSVLAKQQCRLTVHGSIEEAAPTGQCFALFVLKLHFFCSQYFEFG